MRKPVLACLLVGMSMPVSSAASACDCYGYNAGYYGYAAPRVYAYAPAAPVSAYAPVTSVYYDPVWGWTSW